MLISYDSSRNCAIFCWQIRRFSFDVVATCVVGINPTGSSQKELLDVLLKWWAGAFSLGINLPFTKFSESLKARERILRLIQMVSLSQMFYKVFQFFRKKISLGFQT